MEKMTLKEFNKFAIEAIEEYNLKEHNLSVFCLIAHGGWPTYVIQVWDPKKKEHIRSSQYSPSSSLSEFNMKLKVHFNEYLKEETDINI